MPTYTENPSSGNQDGYEDLELSIFNNSSDSIEVGFSDAFRQDVRAFIRFTGLDFTTIGTVTSATLKLTASNTYTLTERGDIYGVLGTDEAAPAALRQITNLTETVAKTDLGNTALDTQYNYDVKSQIEEILSYRDT